MSKKRILICLVCIICLLVALLVFYKNKTDTQNDCRYCVLKDYEVTGAIDDMVFQLNQKKSDKDVNWSLTLNEESVNKKETHQRSIAECLNLLFQDVLVYVKIKDPTVVSYQDHIFMPLKEGTTEAEITIVADIETELLCGPPPQFKKVVQLIVE